MLASRTDRQTAFSRELIARSNSAAESVGGFRERFFELGDQTVQLRFAGPALESSLTMALAHLESAPVAEPDLTISIWDSTSTSTAPPTPTWDHDAYREHGVIRGFFENGFYAVFHGDEKALSVLDEDRREAHFWIEDAHELGLWHRGAPFRTLLHLWLRRRGVQFVHAAAVGRPDGCVLLVGNSGAGKSSTALSCLHSSLRYLGEDYCLLKPGDPPMISSIYSVAKLEPATLERLPALRELATTEFDPGYHKLLVDLNSAGQDQLLDRAPLRAIAVLRIAAGRRTRAEPCSSGEALAAVAPSTLLQLPLTGEPAMERLGQMVASVPCYRLELGSDPGAIPPVLETLLERA